MLLPAPLPARIPALCCPGQPSAGRLSGKQKPTLALTAGGLCTLRYWPSMLILPGGLLWIAHSYYSATLRESQYPNSCPGQLAGLTGSPPTSAAEVPTSRGGALPSAEEVQGDVATLLHRIRPAHSIVTAGRAFQSPVAGSVFPSLRPPSTGQMGHVALHKYVGARSVVRSVAKQGLRHLWYRLAPCPQPIGGVAYRQWTGGDRLHTFHMARRGRYWIASARCAVSVRSLRARLALSLAKGPRSCAPVSGCDGTPVHSSVLAPA